MCMVALLTTRPWTGQCNKQRQTRTNEQTATNEQQRTHKAETRSTAMHDYATELPHFWPWKRASAAIWPPLAPSGGIAALQSPPGPAAVATAGAGPGRLAPRWLCGALCPGTNPYACAATVWPQHHPRKSPHKSCQRQLARCANKKKNNEKRTEINMNQIMKNDAANLRARPMCKEGTKLRQEMTRLPAPAAGAPPARRTLSQNTCSPMPRGCLVASPRTGNERRRAPGSPGSLAGPACC